MFALRLQEQYHFGDLVRFQCNFGYVLAGSSAVICTSSGSWNGTTPECQCKYYFYNVRYSILCTKGEKRDFIDECEFSVRVAGDCVAGARDEY